MQLRSHLNVNTVIFFLAAGSVLSSPGFEIPFKCNVFVQLLYLGCLVIFGERQHF